MNASRHRLLVCAVLLASLGAGALAAQGPAAVAAQGSAAELVWPAPPEPPRIRYVGAFSSEADAGRRVGAWARLSRAVFGGTGPRFLRVERPFDVYADDGSRLYITNGALRAVLAFDRAARRGRLLGGDVPGGLVKPMGLGGDGRGAVYVADAGSRRVVVFGADGRYLRALGGGEVLLNPVDVAVDADAGRVYVADSYLHQVVVFDTLGTVLARIGKQTGDLAASLARSRDPGGSADGSHDDRHGGTGAGEPSDAWENRGGEPGEFRYPVSVAVGPGGTVYVSDQLNFRVQAFDRAGRFVRQFGRVGDVPGTFTRPKGVAVDAEGRVYVVDAAFNNVQVFDDEGRLLIAFGQLGRGSGEHWLPLGIAVDRAGRIYVADRFNNRAQIYASVPAAGGTPAASGSPAPRPQR